MHLRKGQVHVLTLIQLIPSVPVGHEIALGEQCMWWGRVSDATIDDAGRLHCPHCGGRCASARTEAEMLDIARRFEMLGFPYHQMLVRWCRNKCFKTRGDAWHGFILSNGVIG